MENRGPLHHHHRAAVDHAGQAGDSRAQRRAVRVGEADMDAARIEIGVEPAARSVHQLIGDEDGARTELRCQAADRTRPEHPSHTEARRAHILARYGTLWGENSWLRPCRGRKATSC